MEILGECPLFIVDIRKTADSVLQAAILSVPTLPRRFVLHEGSLRANQVLLARMLKTSI